MSFATTIVVGIIHQAGRNGCLLLLNVGRKKFSDVSIVSFLVTVNHQFTVSPGAVGKRTLPSLFGNLCLSFFNDPLSALGIGRVC